jgi:hypothetical protein
VPGTADSSHFDVHQTLCSILDQLAQKIIGL